MEMMDGPTIRAVEASIYAAGYPVDAEAILLIELDGLAALSERIGEGFGAICERAVERDRSLIDRRGEGVRAIFQRLPEHCRLMGEGGVERDPVQPGAHLRVGAKTSGGSQRLHHGAGGLDGHEHRDALVEPAGHLGVGLVDGRRAEDPEHAEEHQTQHRTHDEPADRARPRRLADGDVDDLAVRRLGHVGCLRRTGRPRPGSARRRRSPARYWTWLENNIMMSIVYLFWLFVILFGFVGWMRGWAKELLVAFSVILALGLNHVLRRYIPIAQGPNTVRAEELAAVPLLARRRSNRLDAPG